mgnify:CR=1 FL=1
MEYTPKKQTIEKVDQTGLAISIKSSSPNSFPTAYGDDIWDVVDKDSSLSGVMDSSGQFSQHQINEALAAKAGDVGNKMDKATPDSSGDFAVFDSNGNVISTGVKPESMVTNYENLTHKPTINDVTVNGDMTGEDLGLINRVPDSSGYFAVFTSDGGIVSTGVKPESMVTNYENLTSKPTINDVTVNGNMTGADLGLVDASDGWGLSQNNYTDRDMQWIHDKIAAELRDEALGKYTITTDANPTSFVRDIKSEETMTVTVTLEFYGSNVDPDFTPTGWGKSETGVYTKQSTSSVSTQAWEYTPPSGKYEGIQMSKDSSSKSITGIYPAYYGIVPSGDTSNINNMVSQYLNTSDTRTTTSVNSDKSFTNETGQQAWLWILTYGTATARQSGTSILQNPTTLSFISPNNGNITMSEYKLYISKNPIGVGLPLSNVSINITL